MATLATKPGINGANTLSIPKNWDATWFRSFIANSLKGADVRNAVGANGIVVSGNISSPYATISIGGTGPITLPNIVINNSSGPGIQINSVSTTGGADIRFVAFSPTSKQSYMDWYESDGTTRRAYLGFGDLNDEVFIIDTDTSSGTISLRTNATIRMVVGSAGGVVIQPPDNISQPSLTVNSIAGQFGVQVTGSSTSGSSRGLQVSSGTTSADFCVAFNNQANTVNYLVVRGDGGIGFHGATPQLQTTGFGTPVGGAVVANYNITDAGGANSNTNKCVAEILTILKAYGLIGA